MKNLILSFKSRLAIRCIGFTLCLGVFTFPVSAQNWEQLHKERELKVSATAKTKLDQLRQANKAKNLNLNLAYTSVAGKPLTSITGLKLSKELSPARKAYLEKQPPVKTKVSVGGALRQFNATANVGCVRDQDTCGSCWAFGAMAAYEANYALKSGLGSCMVDVSEQHVVSCSGAGSCGGGDPFGAYEWLVNQSRSVKAEENFPYTATNGTCPSGATSPYYGAVRWGIVNPNNNWTIQPSINSIKDAIVQYGAVTSCLLATDNFVYFGGNMVFNEIPTTSLSGDAVNHCIAIVGWDDNRRAWRIKNSWGTGWAEGGFAWVDYNTNNIGKGTAWIEANANTIPSNPNPNPKLSQNQLTKCSYVGDINGDGLDDLITVNGRRLVATNPDFKQAPILTHTFGADVKRLVIGDFATGGRERGKKQIAAILADGTTQVFAISDDLRSLWWWFTQPTFIDNETEFTVANFDNDIAEEIMLHNPRTGRLQFMKKVENGGFQPMPNFDLGNLGGNSLMGTSLNNVQILVGSFSNDHSHRKDLLVVDHASRQMRVYASVVTNNGGLTFWWAFTTNGGLFNPTDELCVANINGGVQDGLIRRIGSNDYRLYKIEYGGGNLVVETGAQLTQLPHIANRRLVAAKVRHIESRTETGGKNRDDILAIDVNNQQLTSTCARFDGTNLVYWWAYHNVLNCAR